MKNTGRFGWDDLAALPIETTQSGGEESEAESESTSPAQFPSESAETVFSKANKKSTEAESAVARNQTSEMGTSIANTRKSQKPVQVVPAPPISSERAHAPPAGIYNLDSHPLEQAASVTLTNKNLEIGKAEQGEYGSPYFGFHY